MEEIELLYEIWGDIFHDFLMTDLFVNKKSKSILSWIEKISISPTALGFVNLKPKIELTDAGKTLLLEKRISDIITRQLMKFQLPSPYHTDKKNIFFIKPYLEFLRLIKTVGSLSKTETALFFLQLTHINKFESIVNKIYNFRQQRLIWQGNRKEYIQKCFSEEINEIYKDEISNKKFETRESNDITLNKFIKTKKQNMVDYADAIIRYIRATQLITFESKTFRIILSPSKIHEVDYLLRNIDREPFKFKSETDFKEYLFSSNNILLFTDNRNLLLNKLKSLNVGYISKLLNIEQLKDILDESEANIKNKKINEISIQLKNYKEFDDIVEVFSKIQNRDVPDSPLYFEWNTWRAMTMLNYALSIIGNYSIDTDGIPLNIAGGNKPDIEIEYESFKMILEVTLSTGNTQYNMEGEPVARHFGNIQLISSKPVYCFFIAPKISEGALAHFYNLNKSTTRAYGGKTRIIPLTLSNFIKFITVAKEHNFSNSSSLLNLIDRIINFNFESSDEVVWCNFIQKSIENWV